MSDLISRQAALKEAYKTVIDGDVYEVVQAETLMGLPSVQPKQTYCYYIEVVRCKDCKWFNTTGCAIKIADESDKPHEDDFCSFAERRIDE